MSEKKTENKKERKERTYKVKLTDDGNANSKLVMLDAISMIEQGYARMARILNGKATRTINKDTGEKRDYPLEPLSEARLHYFEDKTASLHETTFGQLKAGVRTVIATDDIPD